MSTDLYISCGMFLPFPFRSVVQFVVRRPKVNLGQTTTLGNSEREGRIGLDCLSVNPKRAQMGSLLVLDCTLYILEYMWAARGYP